MHLFLKFSSFSILLLVLFLSIGCGKLTSSEQPQQKTQEAQKVIPKYFILKCTTTLTTETDPIVLQAETQIFTVTDFSTERSKLTMKIDSYTIVAKIIEEARDHEFVLDSAFCHDFFKGSFTETPRCENPRSIRDILAGLEGLPTMEGHAESVNFIHQNQKVSFINSECNLLAENP